MDNLMRGVGGNTPSFNNYSGIPQSALNLNDAPRSSPSLFAGVDDDAFRDFQVSQPSSSGSMGRGSSHPLSRVSPRFDHDYSLKDRSAHLSPPTSSGSMARGSSHPLPRTLTFPRSDEDDSFGDGSAHLSPSTSSGSMARVFQSRPLGHSSGWMATENPSHPPPRRRRGQNASGPMDPRQQMYASITSAVDSIERKNHNHRNESSNAAFCRLIEKELDALPEDRLNQVRQKILAVLWEPVSKSGESS